MWHLAHHSSLIFSERGLETVIGDIGCITLFYTFQFTSKIKCRVKYISISSRLRWQYVRGGQCLGNKSLEGRENHALDFKCHVGLCNIALRAFQPARRRILRGLGFRVDATHQHDDVIKWRSGEFPSQRPVTRSFDVFFDLHQKINDWVNNREAGDLSRHRAHYDVIVMGHYLFMLYR